jgi:CHAT domain-containing protein
LSLPVDVRVHTRIIQADALCRVKESQKAKALLNEASGLLSQDRLGLAAELALTQGRCASSREAAKEYFAHASTLAHGKDEFIEAAGFLNIGFLLLQDERYDQAIDKLLQGLNLTDSPLLRDRMLGNLGFAYSELGDWRKAITFSQQAEKIAERIQNKPAQERWLINLGKAHQALWELPEAEANYVKALSIAQSLNDPTAAAACYNNLTRLSLSRRDIHSALRYLNEGVSLHVDSERLHFAFDEAKIAAAQGRWSDAAELLTDLARKADTDAVLRSLAERELGEVYWHQNKIILADQTFRQGIGTAEGAMAQIKGIEHRMSFLDEERFYDSYIRFLAAQNRSAEALGVAERARAQVWAQDKPESKRRQKTPSAARIQTTLKPQNRVVLAYWITDEESFVWAITPSKFQLFKLPGHLELHRLIDTYNAEIHDHRDIKGSPASAKLYQTLIGPVEALIPKGSHVTIIPSKVLCWVTFDALIGGQIPHYWIEDVDLQIASSLASMPRFESQPQRASSKSSGKDLLILGAPAEANSEFPTLKNAPEEIRRVQSHFASNRETTISGKDATPRAYAAAGPGLYRLIHLDTHGTASDLSPLDSAVILSPDRDNSYKLYAREIKDIPLHADLVTISSCYGAGTRWYNNEGVVGLGWAFLRAGAHQVAAALWEVDDASSPKLMDDFYGELTQGKSAAEALRDAKLKMLHSSDFHRHPNYWASLQLYTGS